MKRKIVRWMLWLVAACFAVAVLDQNLPYSQSHFRRIYAVKLKNSVKEWELLGRPANYAPTNRGKIFLFDRTANVGGTNFQGFMRMEGQPLSEGGYLLADTNAQVLWCDGDGCTAVK